DEGGIVEEWLSSKARTARKYKSIFYRDHKEIDLDGIPNKNRDSLRIGMTDKTLLVSLGARLNVEKCRLVFLFFKSIDTVNFGEPFEILILSNTIPSHIEDDERVKKNVVKYLSAFDDSIVDLRVEVIRNGDGKSHITIDAGHRIIGTDEIRYIPLRLESAGTLKMFALYPFVQDVLENGGILFVDELNARLHPLLVRTFVQLFLNPNTNKHNAQIIFTTHDSWMLNNGMFRRDELWFTEKKNGCSQLYSLAEFVDEDGKSIRNDENYEKNYLLGKYGGIPSLKSLDVFNGGYDDGKE
ncbi:MAG: ATP/GTP-binding protein, partial [Candidatus Ornithospirochaeta sp.]